MPKANVNTASREQLVEAGLRAELADEILKLRRRGQVTGVEALGELPGVGPATLEQLRQSLRSASRAGTVTTATGKASVAAPGSPPGRRPRRGEPPRGPGPKQPRPRLAACGRPVPWPRWSARWRTAQSRARPSSVGRSWI